MKTGWSKRAFKAAKKIEARERAEDLMHAAVMELGGDLEIAAEVFDRVRASVRRRDLARSHLDN